MENRKTLAELNTSKNFVYTLAYAAFNPNKVHVVYTYAPRGIPQALCNVGRTIKAFWQLDAIADTDNVTCEKCLAKIVKESR